MKLGELITTNKHPHINSRQLRMICCLLLLVVWSCWRAAGGCGVSGKSLRLPPRGQNLALHRARIGTRKFIMDLIEPYRIAGGALRKFCVKFLDPYSSVREYSVREYIARALRHQPQPRSIAPLQRWRGQHEEERRCKAGGPSRIRQMGERSPRRRQEDGWVCLLRILRERKARPSRFPCCRQQMANRSWLASSRRSIERLTPRPLIPWYLLSEVSDAV